MSENYRKTRLFPAEYSGFRQFPAAQITQNYLSGKLCGFQDNLLGVC